MREDEKRERIPLRENEQQWRGRKLQVREHFCTVMGRVENVCVRGWSRFLFHREANSGGVCMWVRTDCPTSPLPKAINYLNQQQSLFNEGGWNKKKMGEDTWVFPQMAQGLTIFPTPYPCENHAPFSF